MGTSPTIFERLQGLLNKVANLLTGEPLRAIGYGAAVVIWLVANASGKFADMSFESAIVLSTTAIGTLSGIIETARKFVYSPNSVQTIANEAFDAGAAGAPQPAVPAPPADKPPVVDLGE